MASYAKMSPQARAIAYLAFERYLVWCELMRHAAETPPELKDDGSANRLNVLRARTGKLFLRFHWFAALCPVIEGWEKLKLSNERIDKLLYKTPNGRQAVDHLLTLRLFRHSIYHYQETFFEPKHLGALDLDFIRWCDNVFTAFKTFVEEHGADPDTDSFIMAWATAAV